MRVSKFIKTILEPFHSLKSALKPLSHLRSWERLSFNPFKNYQDRQLKWPLLQDALQLPYGVVTLLSAVVRLPFALLRTLSWLGIWAFSSSSRAHKTLFQCFQDAALDIVNVGATMVAGVLLILNSPFTLCFTLTRLLSTAVTSVYRHYYEFDRLIEDQEKCLKDQEKHSPFDVEKVLRLMELAPADRRSQDRVKMVISVGLDHLQNNEAILLKLLGKAIELKNNSWRHACFFTTKKNALRSLHIDVLAACYRFYEFGDQYEHIIHWMYEQLESDQMDLSVVGPKLQELVTLLKLSPLHIDERTGSADLKNQIVASALNVYDAHFLTIWCRLSNEPITLKQYQEWMDSEGFEVYKFKQVMQALPCDQDTGNGIFLHACHTGKSWVSDYLIRQKTMDPTKLTAAQYSELLRVWPLNWNQFKQILRAFSLDQDTVNQLFPLICQTGDVGLIRYCIMHYQMGSESIQAVSADLKNQLVVSALKDYDADFLARWCLLANDTITLNQYRELFESDQFNVLEFQALLKVVHPDLDTLNGMYLLACQTRRMALLRLLQLHYKVDPKTLRRDGVTPLMAAVRTRDNVDVIRHLVETCQVSTSQALHCVHSEEPDYITYLDDHGADVLERHEKTDQTALEAATAGSRAHQALQSIMPMRKLQELAHRTQHRPSEVANIIRLIEKYTAHLREQDGFRACLGDLFVTLYRNQRFDQDTMALVGWVAQDPIEGKSFLLQRIVAEVVRQLEDYQRLGYRCDTYQKSNPKTQQLKTFIQNHLPQGQNVAQDEALARVYFESALGHHSMPLLQMMPEVFPSFQYDVQALSLVIQEPARLDLLKDFMQHSNASPDAFLEVALQQKHESTSEYVRFLIETKGANFLRIDRADLKLDSNVSSVLEELHPRKQLEQFIRGERISLKRVLALLNGYEGYFQQPEQEALLRQLQVKSLDSIYHLELVAAAQAILEIHNPDVGMDDAVIQSINRRSYYSLEDATRYVDQLGVYLSEASLIKFFVRACECYGFGDDLQKGKTLLGKIWSLNRLKWNQSYDVCLDKHHPDVVQSLSLQQLAVSHVDSQEPQGVLSYLFEELKMPINDPSSEENKSLVTYAHHNKLDRHVMASLFSLYERQSDETMTATLGRNFFEKYAADIDRPIPAKFAQPIRAVYDRYCISSEDFSLMQASEAQFQEVYQRSWKALGELESLLKQAGGAKILRFELERVYVVKDPITEEQLREKLTAHVESEQRRAAWNRALWSRPQAQKATVKEEKRLAYAYN